ncbi:hypothetical protein TNCV_2123301 [Trichonephila clavipes]|nr:hypothetical protein TNCV_2123301 [Trichonephila clavipes]
MLKISPKKRTPLHWKTNSEGLPVLAHLSVGETRREAPDSTNQPSKSFATPSSGRNLWRTRHPHVHLAAAAQSLFDPEGIEHRRPEDEKCFELTRGGGQQILLSQNIGL